MHVQQILNAKGDRVVTVQPAATVRDAVRLLDVERVGAVVVIGPRGDVVGIMSERDVVRGLASSGTDLLDAPVAGVMTRAVTTCTPDSDLEGVMRTMTAGRFRHVPVLRDGRLAGIVSIGDVVKNRLEQLEAETEQLQSYIKS